MIKHSRQRDCIKAALISRHDHPTAEDIYLQVKEVIPNISLATVYRNLSLLSELGEITKIQTNEKSDHYDGNMMPHNHFICKECGRITDLETDPAAMPVPVTDISFDGHIDGHRIYFFGTCGACLKKQPVNDL